MPRKTANPDRAHSFVRLPRAVHDHLVQLSKENNRTITKELLHRLNIGMASDGNMPEPSKDKFTEVLERLNELNINVQQVAKAVGAKTLT